MLERATTDDDREIAAAIVTAAQRAAALTRQMLAYAGQRDLGRREPVDVGQLVQELRALLAATLSKKADLELAIDPASVVLGDPVTLSQVIMNLLTNASDALGDHPGRITVRVRHVTEVDARWDHGQGATVGPGRWVLVEVEDTGIGMDESTCGRVFEPFFSTKERGHGLGLAACLGIVRAHGGAVLVESELGRGSRFSVLLPASGAAKRADDAARPRATARPCRVLVVDDEALVRSQLRRSLELRGYSVIEAANGRSALAALEQESKTGADDARAIDVVILDMTMPDLDGAEVLRRLRAAGSRVPVVDLLRLPRHRRRAAPAAWRVSRLSREALRRHRARGRNRTCARPIVSSRSSRRALRDRASRWSRATRRSSSARGAIPIWTPS